MVIESWLEVSRKVEQFPAFKRVFLCKMPVKGAKIDSLANFIQVDE